MLLSFYIFFVLYYFDYQDYGNSYASFPKEHVNSFLTTGSWINGTLVFWIGITSWITPIPFLILGYRLLKLEKIKYLFIKIIFVFIGIFLICGGLKNMGQDESQLSFLSSKLLLWTEKFISADNKSIIVNITSIFIGSFLILLSLDFKFKIYNKFILFIIKTGSIIVNNFIKVLVYFYRVLISLVLGKKIKIIGAKKRSITKKAFQKNRLLI